MNTLLYSYLQIPILQALHSEMRIFDTVIKQRFIWWFLTVYIYKVETKLLK